MNHNINKQHVCIINNLYTLLQYLLLSSERNIKETIFFFERDIKDCICKHFKHIKLYEPNGKLNRIIFRIFIHYFSKIKWPFLKNCIFYGQDNLAITSPIIGNKKIILLEDGVLSYFYKPKKNKFSLIRRLIGGSLYSQNPLGYSINVDKMYLTGLYEIPEQLKEKVTIINLYELWNKSTQSKKNLILKIFGLTDEIINCYKKCESLLITQPLSEDGIILESEKIELYKNLLSKENSCVAIKTHPREKTLYNEYFNNVEILDLPIPFELLSLVGCRFKRVYTLFSTAALSIPYDIDIHFIGTSVHPKLLQKFGKIEYNCSKL